MMRTPLIEAEHERLRDLLSCVYLEWAQIDERLIGLGLVARRDRYHTEPAREQVGPDGIEPYYERDGSVNQVSYPIIGLARRARPRQRAAEEGMMDRTEIIAEMSRRGYTHVETYGGPVALEKWRPYADASRWQGRIQGANEVHDEPVPGSPSKGFVLGLWTFTRYEFMDCPTCNLTFGYDAALGKPAGCTYCDR